MPALWKRCCRFVLVVVAVAVAACSDEAASPTSPATDVGPAQSVEIDPTTLLPRSDVSISSSPLSALRSTNPGGLELAESAPRVLVFGRFLTRNRVAARIASTGAKVTNLVDLPVDLTGFDVVIFSGLQPLNGSEVQRLQGFVRSGGGLHLTGENGNLGFDYLHRSLEPLINGLVDGPTIDLSGTVPFGFRASVNVAVLGGLATTPNPLSFINMASSGTLIGPPRNVFFTARGATVGAAWDESDMTAGSGRMTLLMDANTYFNASTGPALENILAFLLEDAPPPPSDDTPPPTVAVDVTGPAGLDGWYTGDVQITWSVNDDESEVTTNGCEAQNVTADTGGSTFTCTATSDGGSTTESVTIKRDATPPTVTYDGNAGSYDVAADVAITCTADDNLPGVASTTCSDVAGRAYAFGLGRSSFTAGAVDVAGNEGSSTTSFEVTASADGLATLVDEFVSKRGVANALRKKLEAAERARNDQSRNGSLRAFINQVEAQAGKAMSESDAAVLITIAEALMG